jgi:hypothetical protein
VSATAPTPTAPTPLASDYRRWPLYWFALFEGALESGDLEQAAEAQLRLEQLGLRVEPIAPWQGKGRRHAS